MEHRYHCSCRFCLWPWSSATCWAPRIALRSWNAYTDARTWAKIRVRVCASAHMKTRTNTHNYRCTSRSYQTLCSKDLNRGVYVHTNSYFLNFWKYTHKIVRALSEFCSIQRCWWRRRLPALSVRGIYYKLSFLRPSPEGLCACVLV